MTQADVDVLVRGAANKIRNKFVAASHRLEADDLKQEFFLHVAKRQIDTSQLSASRVFQIAYRRMLDYVRVQLHLNYGSVGFIDIEDAFTDRRPSPLECVVSAERLRSFYQALDERSRRVVSAYYEEGKTLAQIGMREQITEARVCQLLRDARQVEA